ncbi:ABC transporter permease [Danxiaibacter flavus]|uniref:ABC transporter permease n=1 Tax=Danxiaibacter flavus TaxID=3049108 RepID=A0ABV3ZDM6_9BACT|nr:ABC transporter permease [Chitinophagaceae bacterium DXS]
MFKNYFKTAFRSLQKNKGFTAINVFGLAAGIATCLIIMLYVTDELSYDKFNINAQRIYRIDNQIKFGNNAFDIGEAPAAMGPAFAAEYPQIEHYTRFRNRGPITITKGDEKIVEDKVIYADSSLFNVFTLPIVDGDQRTALKEPQSVAITESAAKRYFGNARPLGKTMEINSKPYRVSAVIKNIPSQSHFNYDFFLPLSGLDESREIDWLSENFHTYIVVKEGTDIAGLEKQFNKSLEAAVAPELKSVANIAFDDFKKDGGYVRCSLMPLLKIHLHSNKPDELSVNGNLQYVYIFSAIAIFILLIACVNFMNLSTARSSNRAKEVGVRKVLGSDRRNLITQFLTESFVISFIAFMAATVLTFLLLPLFNHLAQKNISGLVLLAPSRLAVIVALMIVVSLLAGSYPAFFLSSFQPVDVLKGKLAKGFKGSVLRNALVVFQFAISITLMVGTTVIYSQLNYIHQKDVGFNKEQVLIIQNTSALGSQSEAFKNEVMQLPVVKAATFTGYLPTNNWRNSTGLFPDMNFDVENAILSQEWEVDENYIPTMQMQLVSGRNFSKDFATDSNAIIINEAAAKYFEGKDPINKKMYAVENAATKKISSFSIVGVIKNFNFNSLREQVTPLALLYRKNLGSLALRINTADIPGLVSQLKSKWKVMAPSHAFSYTFMDEEFNKQYQADQRTGSLSITFSILAILIACLGLLGLVTYAAEQRIKEIGIRKVLGANVTGIIAMLSGDFVKLVCIAVVIATPVAWLAMNKWLQEFAYRITIQLWLFALAGIIALIIALATVSFQAIKAAMANPVKSLRSE